MKVQSTKPLEGLLRTDYFPFDVSRLIKLLKSKVKGKVKPTLSSKHGLASMQWVLFSHHSIAIWVSCLQWGWASCSFRRPSRHVLVPEQGTSPSALQVNACGFLLHHQRCVGMASPLVQPSLPSHGGKWRNNPWWRDTGDMRGWEVLFFSPVGSKSPNFHPHILPPPGTWSKSCKNGKVARGWIRGA